MGIQSLVGKENFSENMMKNKCFFCVPILGGAKFVGYVALLISWITLVLTIPYLADIDENVFNPLKKILSEGYEMLEDALKDAYSIFHTAHHTDSPEAQRTMEEVKKNVPIAILIITLLAGLKFILTFLMVCGIKCAKRSLMLPYIIVYGFKALMVTLSNIAIVGFSFWLVGINIGTILLALAIYVVLIASIYFNWIVILEAYKEMGIKGFRYEPASNETMSSDISYRYYDINSKRGLYL